MSTDRNISFTIKVISLVLILVAGYLTKENSQHESTKDKVDLIQPGVNIEKTHNVKTSGSVALLDSDLFDKIKKN